MTPEDTNELGEAIDSLENLIGALALPLPPEMHVAQLRHALPKVARELKAAFVSVTGENPWGI